MAQNGSGISLWDQGSARGQVVDVFGVNKPTDYAVAGKRARGRAPKLFIFAAYDYKLHLQ